MISGGCTRSTQFQIDAREPVPVALINDFLYCPRRAALKIVEGWHEENEHTARGDVVHEHTDLSGFEVVKGVTLLRALPIWSERLGLNGKCDIVERHPDGELRPVDFKLGKRRRWENDDAQLCAQAICLEEMFGRPVLRGAIFHADSKRRREVEFTAHLRLLVEQTVARLHELFDIHSGNNAIALPKAEWKPACSECSLYKVCMPQMTSLPPRLDGAAAMLFRVHD